MKEFFLRIEPAILGISLPSVGLQSCPGLGVVAAAIWRSFSLAVLPENICSSSQEKPGENTVYQSSTATHLQEKFLKRPKLNRIYHHSSKGSPSRRLKLTWHSQDGSPGQRCAAESLHECWQPAGHNGHWGGAPRYQRCQKMLPSGGICSLPRMQENMRQQLYNLWGFKIQNIWNRLDRCLC